MGERLMCSEASDTQAPGLLTEAQAAEVLQQLAADYGMAAVRAKWEGLTPLQVKANLAKRLGKFSWGAIRRALDVAPNRFPDFPPNTGQLVALCDSFEPAPIHKALPAPDIHPAVIAARQEEAEAMAKKALAPRVDHKAWAKLHRTAWMKGASLTMVQHQLASSALGERWHEDNGRRECSEILDEVAA